jgi:hypothetical protein
MTLFASVQSRDKHICANLFRSVKAFTCIYKLGHPTYRCKTIESVQRRSARSDRFGESRHSIRALRVHAYYSHEIAPKYHCHKHCHNIILHYSPTGCVQLLLFYAKRPRNTTRYDETAGFLNFLGSVADKWPQNTMQHQSRALPTDGIVTLYLIPPSHSVPHSASLSWRQHV